LGLIEAAALHLKGEIRVVGLPSRNANGLHQSLYGVGESTIHASAIFDYMTSVPQQGVRP
jgi:hypothetical protein